MFIRFATDRLDEDTHKPLGVFAVAYQLLDGDSLEDFQRTEIRETLDWFKTYLPIPDRFVHSRKPNREGKGICRFKSSATECITHIRYLAHLVSDQNIGVGEMMTEKPGYAIYEDDFQIVAEPFAKTPQSERRASPIRMHRRSESGVRI